MDIVNSRTRIAPAGLALRRAWRRAPDALLLGTLLAVVLALVAPSRQLASHSDLILALLVLLTALGIAPSQLAGVGANWRALLALSVGPLTVLVPLAWAIGQAFDAPVRDGTLALGLTSTEAAAVGLVALAGGNAALAAAALAGSLVVAAVVGPVLAGLLASGTSDAGTLALSGRFALVVLLPLAGGLATRRALPALARGEPEFAAASTVTVVVLVYAALSGGTGQSMLGSQLAAAAAFLAVSSLPALAWARYGPPATRTTGPLVIALRDFAVAAALATQAFGPAAGAVAGTYGVLMLVAGAATTTALRRRARRNTPAPPAA